MPFPSYTPPFRKNWSNMTPLELGSTLFPSEVFRQAEACRIYDRAGLFKGFRLGKSTLDTEILGLTLFAFTEATAVDLDGLFEKANVDDRSLCMFFSPSDDGGSVVLLLKASHKLEKQLKLGNRKRLNETRFQFSNTRFRQALTEGLTFESLLALVTARDVSMASDTEETITDPSPLFDAGSINDGQGLDGPFGHYDIEKVAFDGIFKFEEIAQIYYGNWLRDFNQINLAFTVGPTSPSKKDLTECDKVVSEKKPFELAKLKEVRPYFTQEQIRGMIEILAVKEFVQRPYREKKLPELKNPQSFNEMLDVFHKQFGKLTCNILGIYRPEEHIDNPWGLEDDSWAYPWLYYDYEFAYKQYFKKAAGQAVGPYAGAKGPGKEKLMYNDAGERAKDPAQPRGMKHYIIFDAVIEPQGETVEKKWVSSYYPSAATYLKRELSLAVQYGKTIEGFRHLGAAMHTLEDFFAHSNFCEVTMIKLGEVEVFPWVDYVEETFFDPNSGVEKPEYEVVKAPFKIADTPQGPATVTPLSTYIPIVTGRFLTDDTKASIAPKLADAFFDLRFQPFEERKPGERSTSEMLILAMLENHVEKSAEEEGQPVAAPGDITLEQGQKLLKNYKRFLALQDGIRRYRDKHPLLHAVLNGVGTVTAFVGQTLSIMPKIALHMALTGVHHHEGDKQTETKGTNGTNPSHTQLAKDLGTHPLNNFAATLAIHAVRDVGQRIKKIWDQMPIGGGAPIERDFYPAVAAEELADYVIQTYFIHPCKTDWMDEITREWMLKHPNQIALSHHPYTLKKKKKILLDLDTFKKELREYLNSLRNR